MIETTEIKKGLGFYVFGAQWCCECHLAILKLEVLEHRFNDVPFYHIDVDKADDELLNKYEINEMPAILKIRDGKVVARWDRTTELTDWMNFAYYF